MIDWLLETGLYLLGVAVVPLVGVLLVSGGLWGDRSKGRPRCPKCWYDMRGSLPRLTCPECGHAVGSERGLYRNRRRGLEDALGVMLVPLLSYPLTIVGGWYREQAIDRALLAKQWEAPRRIGPDWIVSRLPDGLARFFERRFTAFVRSDRDLAFCRRLRYVRVIYASRPVGVTDAGLAHLAGLSQLQALSLRGTPVTDAGLVHLKGLSRLKDLDLVNTQVTDAGLVHVKVLPQLLLLALSGPRITDAGLAHLEGMPHLSELILAGTQVTDAGVAKLHQARPHVHVVR